MSTAARLLLHDHSCIRRERSRGACGRAAAPRGGSVPLITMLFVQDPNRPAPGGSAKSAWVARAVYDDLSRPNNRLCCAARSPAIRSTARDPALQGPHLHEPLVRPRTERGTPIRAFQWVDGTISRRCRMSRDQSAAAVSTSAIRVAVIVRIGTRPLARLNQPVTAALVRVFGA